MGGFKRFCMFVFGLAGLLGVIALSLTWVGPWTSQASALMSLEYYFYAVEVCVAIALVIMLVVLLRAIFARKGQEIVEMNLAAFRAGYQYAQKQTE